MELPAAYKRVKSAEAATLFQNAVIKGVGAHVVPEFVAAEPKEMRAIIRLPSAEEAAETHSVTGALLEIQVAPEFVEV